MHASARLGASTNVQDVVTPVDVSDADLICYMSKSPMANKQAGGDVKKARVLYFTDWWKKGYVVHCPRSTGDPYELTDDEAARYLHGYLDLKKTFVDDVQGAKKHWKQFGYKEGRVVPSTYTPLFQKIISLVSGASGKYCGTSNGTPEVSCSKAAVTDTERYLVEQVKDGELALKNYARNKYCSYDGVARGMVCDKDTVGKAEGFQFKNLGRSGLLLRNSRTQTFCGDDGGGRVICNAFKADKEGQIFGWSESVPVATPSSTATTAPPAQDMSKLEAFAAEVLATNASNRAMAAAVIQSVEAVRTAKAVAEAALTSATNARTAVMKAKAAAAAANTAARNATENLKLKTTQTLSPIEALKLDIMASVTSATASKSMALASQADKVLQQARMHMLAAKNAALKALEANKVANGVRIGELSVHASNVTKAAQAAVAFAEEAQQALQKAQDAEQEALNILTSFTRLQDEQKQSEERALATAVVPLPALPAVKGLVENITAEVVAKIARIETNVNAVKATTDAAKAQDNAAAATQNAIEATTNAQIASQNANAAAQIAMAATTIDQADAAAMAARAAAQTAAEAKTQATMATEAAKDAQAVASAATNVAVLPGSETVAKPTEARTMGDTSYTTKMTKKPTISPALLVMPAVVVLLAVVYRTFKK